MDGSGLWHDAGAGRKKRALSPAAALGTVLGAGVPLVLGAGALLGRRRRAGGPAADGRDAAPRS